MPRTVTQAQLISFVQDEADVRDPPFTEAILLKWINIARARFYIELAKADPDRFWKEETLTIVSGTADYAFPSDHLFTHQAALLGTDGKYHLMERFQVNEMYDRIYDGSDRELARYREVGSNFRVTPTPLWSGSIKHCYIPTLADLASASTTTDCIHGWEEYIISDVCAKCRVREDADPKEFLRRRSEVLKDIRTLGSARNVTTPDKITDTRWNVLTPNYGRP